MGVCVWVAEFYNFLSLRKEEVDRRKALVEAIERSTLELWPDVTVCVHGSIATGLMLPTSDIDLAIFGVEGNIEKALRTIAEKLNADHLFTSYEVIAKTRVPIVKFVSVDGIPG
jgi:non-canonical poly(A) RNA polymerase PAPD5/7